MNVYACIDIGGTVVKYGLINADGRIIKTEKTATEAQRGGPAILHKVKEIVRKLQREHAVSGIAVSTAGMVDTESGEIFYAAPLIPDYAGINFKEELEKEFHVPCEVENDVNCAGLAESISGAAKGCKTVLCLTVGTGIGGCMLIDGHVFHGAGDSACEVGYMHMSGSDFQTLGSARTLIENVAERKGEASENWNGYRIFEAAGKGDDICGEAISEMVEVLGIGIANICYVFNPEIVVLGGGVMEQEKALKGRLEEALKKYLVPCIAERTKLAFAKHKNEAGMLGAYYHLMYKLRQE